MALPRGWRTWWLAGFLALPAASWSAQADKDNAIVPGPTEMLVDGVLTSLQREGVHRVALAKGKHYGFQLTSRGFFASARLEDDKGKALETFAGFTVIEASGDGVFRLVVDCRAGSSGEYKITIQQMPPPKPPQALTIPEKGLTHEDTLEKQDSRDKIRKHICKRYDVPLTAGKTYVIDMISKKFDAFLRFEDDQGKQLAQDDDGGGGNNARITFGPKTDGAYRIIATSYGGGIGAFTLKIREEVPKK